MGEKLNQILFSLWLHGYRTGLTGREYDFKRDRKSLDDSIINEAVEELSLFISKNSNVSDTKETRVNA